MGVMNITMAGECILVVDDEPSVVSVVKAYLEKEGYRVVTAADGLTAWDAFEREQPDLVVLDLMLPGLPGQDVCRRIRHAGDTPVIMLTARTEETDKIVGLKMGADDYVTKPFSPRELVARVEAVLRRSRLALSGDGADGGTGEGNHRRDGRTRLVRGPLVVDPDKHEARWGGEILDLTPTEFSLLETLARRPGRVFTRMELMEMAKGEAYEGYERTIDSHIKNLRRKLKQAGMDGEWIKTVFGVGYKFAGPS